MRGGEEGQVEGGREGGRKEGREGGVAQIEEGKDSSERLHLKKGPKESTRF